VVAKGSKYQAYGAWEKAPCQNEGDSRGTEGLADEKKTLKSHWKSGFSTQVQEGDEQEKRARQGRGTDVVSQHDVG
jgi:hypothetical protein